MVNELTPPLHPQLAPSIYASYIELEDAGTVFYPLIFNCLSRLGLPSISTPPHALVDKRSCFMFRPDMSSRTPLCEKQCIISITFAEHIRLHFSFI